MHPDTQVNANRLFTKEKLLVFKAGFLDATDRFGVLDDTYALCFACKQPLSALLSLMDVYRQELDYSVLSGLIDIAYKVSSMVSDAIPPISC